MGADAGYLSLIQHNDALSMHDTGNTLCHQQNRTSGFLTQFVQCLSQAGICFEIQCGEGIIKYINFRFLTSALAMDKR